MHSFALYAVNMYVRIAKNEALKTGFVQWQLFI